MKVIIGLFKTKIWKVTMIAPKGKDESNHQIPDRR